MSQDDEPMDERFADWVDGRLSPSEQERLEEELESDAALRRQAEEYRATVLVLRQHLATDEPPAGIVSHVMEALPARVPKRTRLLPLIASLSAAAAAAVLYFTLDGLLSGPGSVEPDSSKTAVAPYKKAEGRLGKTAPAEPGANLKEISKLDLERSRPDGVARKREVQDDLEKGGVKKAERPRSKDAPPGAAQHGVAQQGAAQQELEEEEVQEGREAKAGKEADPSDLTARARRQLKAKKELEGGRVPEPAPEQILEHLAKSVLQPSGENQPRKPQAGAAGPAAAGPAAAGPTLPSGVPVETVPVLVVTLADLPRPRPKSEGKAVAPPARQARQARQAPKVGREALATSRAGAEALDFIGYFSQQRAQYASNVVPPALVEVKPVAGLAALAERDKRSDKRSEANERRYAGDEKRPAPKRRGRARDRDKAVEFVPGKSDRIYSVTGDEQQIRSVFQILRGYLETKKRLAGLAARSAGYSLMVQQVPKELLELDAKLRKFTGDGEELHMGQTRKRSRESREKRSLSFYLVLRGK